MTSVLSGRPPSPEVAAPDGARPRLRWAAVWCKLPARPTRPRLAAWRELGKLHALNLQPTLWAVPFGASGALRLDPLLRVVEPAGGAVRHRVVTGDDDGDADLDRQLTDACEHLWDSFFNDVDRFGVRIERGGDASAWGAELERIRARYVETYVHDLIGSDAADRAWDRLRRCADGMLDVAGADAVDEDERGVAHAIRPLLSSGRDDGRTRHTITLDPLPTEAWERAFRAFEGWVYHPDPRRVPFARGMFDVDVAGADATAVTASLAARVERFECSLH